MRDLHAIPKLFTKLFADASWVKYPCALLTALVAYVLPTEQVQNATIAAGALMLLDTVTGVVAARVSGKAISSASFSRVLVKILAYGSVVLVAALTARNVPSLGFAHEAVVMGVVVLIILTEGISIIENARRMGVKVPPGIDKLLQDKIDQVTAPEPQKVTDN